jgi:hypothetical protein
MLGQPTLTHLLSRNFAAALQSGRDALRELYEMRCFGRIPDALKGGASLALAAGWPDVAVRLAAAAERLIDELGGGLPDALTVGDPLEEARALLTRDHYARGVEEG